MSINQFDQFDELFSTLPTSLSHFDLNAEFNPDDFVTILDQDFAKTANLVIEAFESVQTSSFKINNYLNFEESDDETVEQSKDDGLQDRWDLFQDGFPRSEPSLETPFKEGEDMLGLEDEFTFLRDLHYTYDRRNSSDSSLSSTTTTSTTTTVQSDDALERSSKSNQNGVAKFALNCANGCEKVVGAELLHKDDSAQRSEFPSVAIVSKPLYQLDWEDESNADIILMRNTLINREGGVTPTLESQYTHSHGANECLTKLDENSKKRKSSMAKPRSASEPPKKEKKVVFKEEPLLQLALPGLESLRAPNKFDEYSTFESVDEIDPLGDQENAMVRSLITYVNYNYEIGPRAHVNAFESLIVRRKHTDLDHTGSGYEALCPYCPEMKFLPMCSPAYRHHMIIRHGVFPNGEFVKEPGTCVKQVLGNDGEKVKAEFFKCPYDCDSKLIRMKNFNPLLPNDSRYKAYLRHVNDCHSCGRQY